MNAERLHAIAKFAQAELVALNVVTQVDALVAGLRGLANQPSDAASQQQISEARTALQALAAAPSNEWPSSDRQVADELGLLRIMGSELLGRVEGILARNEMTPSVAADEIGPIAEEVRNGADHLSALGDALDYFGVGFDEP